MADLVLEEVGVTTGGQQMDNGERRFRLMHEDGSGYIRTEAGAEGAWQNAHYHKGVRETYIVQSGWMAFATFLEDGSYDVAVYSTGDVVSSEPDQHHNVFLPKDAVIHTIKHGAAVGNPEKDGHPDWFEANPVFDSWTKSLDLAGIAAAADVSYAMIAY